MLAIRVYREAPFGQQFGTQAELEIVLRGQPYLTYHLDLNNRLSVYLLNEQIEGFKGIFYYEFEQKHGKAPSGRIIRRVQVINDMAILDPTVECYFVLYDPTLVEERSYFKVGIGLSTRVIDEAIELATTIIRGERAVRILLICNSAYSAIEDVQIEFIDQQLQVLAMNEKQLIKSHFPSALFEHESLTAVLLNPDLIDLTTKLPANTQGFRRAVLFVATAILHESVQKNKHMQLGDQFVTRDLSDQTWPNSQITNLHESDWYFEQELLGGLLEIQFDMDNPTDLKLVLSSDEANPLIFCSNKAEYVQQSLTRSERPVKPNLGPIDELSPTEEDMINITMYPCHQTPNFEASHSPPMARLKISLKNVSNRDVHLPKDYLPLHPLNIVGFQILEDGSKIKLTRPSCKPLSLSLYEASLLKIGESREYQLDDIGRLFKMKYGCTYEIHFQLRITTGFSGIKYRFLSNMQIIRIGWPRPSEQCSPSSVIRMRIPLQDICQILAAQVGWKEPTKSNS